MPDWHWLDYIENPDGTAGGYFWIENGRAFDDDGNEVDLSEEDAIDAELGWLRKMESAPIDAKLEAGIRNHVEEHGGSVRDAHRRLADSGYLAEHRSKPSVQVRGAQEDYTRHAGRKPSGQAGAGGATEFDPQQRQRDAATLAEQDAAAARQARQAEIEDGEF